MFTFSTHPELGLLVGVYSGSSNTPEDHETSLQEMKKLLQSRKEHPDGVASILVVDPENPRPDATQRKKIAEVRATEIVPKFFTAVVTQSLTVRGVITVLEWISPAPPHYETAAFASVEEAAAWIEQRRGVKLPLVSLYHQARALAERSRATSR